MGGPQIRNIGTIGGNVCNGVTSADSASTLFVLNAKRTCQWAKTGERTVPIAEFYAGPERTVRAHDEILTEICIDKADYAGFGAHYIKYALTQCYGHHHFSTHRQCARLSADKRIIEDMRLAFGVAGPVPMQCPKAEAAINGRPVSESIAAIGDIAVTEVSPRTSWRASKEFRLQLVRELRRRVLRRAIENAGGCVPSRLRRRAAYAVCQSK